MVNLTRKKERRFMANNIKGITIELGGDSSGLDKALKGVNTTSVKLNSELKEVNKLLKFDPSNATGLAQKQELLTKSIENTSDKLAQLKSAQSQVEQQFANGKIGEEQYRAFNREISTTEQSLNSYKTQLAGLQTEQVKLGQNTDRLNTYFSASSKSVDDFADILGTRLVNSIKNGTASSDMLEVALNKIGKEALGADVDINKFKSTLDSVKSGNSLDSVKNELQEISPKAKDAGGSLDEMTGAINNGNMQQGAEAIAKVGEKVLELGEKAKETALEFGSSFGKISANTNLSKAEMEELKGVATDVFKSGVTDSIETATDATILMKTAFKDLNNEDLTNLTSQVISLSERTGTDVAENVRGTSQLMKAFGLDSTQAFDLVASGYKNGLNYSDDFMDTLNEYAPLFATAGYSAQEMLQILQNGMENGSMNTDKTADAVKELQIRLGDGSMDKAVESFSDNTKGVFEKWKGGQATVKDVASSIQEDLKKMSPQDQQKALSTLSTQFEDLGIKGALSLFDIKGGFDNVKGSMDSATEKDPAQEWQSSWNTFSTSLQQIGVDILTALQPVLDFFANLSEKFGSLPEPLRIFIEVVGGLIAVFTILAPILGGIALLAGGLEIALLPLIGIVLAVIAVIALIVVAIQNWGAIVDWLKGVWDAFAGWISGLWDGIGQTASKVWNWIKDTISGVWDGIKNGVSNAINSVKNTMSNIWESIKSMTKSAWDGLKSMITTPINAAKDIVSGIIDKIKGLFNFKLKFPDISIPHIPMPHFNISGSFNPLKGQIPKIGIDWFADGGILTRPTIFGANGNNLMGGGEAGKEAVAPLSDLMAYVRTAVKQEIGGMDANFAQMIQLLTIIAGKDLSLNMDGKAVSEIIDNHLANNQAQLDFGIGRT
jgi:phage-related minor tail protein